MVGVVLGGIGLFLLGMALLTDGLQAAAGDALRTALRRCTRSTFSSIVTGAAVTAVVQSSSATTLATIGFVGAGLLRFSAALGIVYGANVGTTATAWIVATVGLNVDASTFALPLVGAGAMAKLFLTGRRAAVGAAVAGFGLVFVGIDVLQTGMAELRSVLDPSRHSGTGWGSPLTFVVVGALSTVVMQSSSAAVATTLTALAAGTIDLPQAAALVIGQNVGTTVTALIGAAGGSAPMRRTALAHLTFNVASGAVALALLPVFLGFAVSALAAADPAVMLAAFHTSFNVLGVVLFAPFTQRFADFLERVVVEEGATLTRRLRTGRIALPSALFEAVRFTARDITAEALGISQRLLAADAPVDVTRRLRALERALDTTRERLASIRTSPALPAEHGQHVGNLHALDHLSRLVEALAESGNAAAAIGDPEVRPMVGALAPAFEEAISVLKAPAGVPVDALGQASAVAAASRREARPRVLAAAAAAGEEPQVTERRLEAMRWVDRIGYHAWRAAYHLELRQSGAKSDTPLAPRSEGRRTDESHEIEP